MRFFHAVLLVAALSATASAQTWNDLGPGRPETVRGPIRPAAFRAVTVDAAALELHLAAAPHESDVRPQASPAVLTLPRVLDAAAVFMPGAPAATRALVAAAFAAAPSLEHDLEAALPALLAALDGARTAAQAAVTNCNKPLLIYLCGMLCLVSLLKKLIPSMQTPASSFWRLWVCTSNSTISSVATCRLIHWPRF